MKSKTGWPIQTIPDINESVGKWVTRFEAETFRSPIALDFEAHALYPSVKIAKLPHELENTECIRDAMSICNTIFKKHDWFLTNDLQLWLSNEHCLVLFKLSWTR